MAFAVLLGIVVDHALRWWHKYLERKDAARAAAREASESAAPAVDRKPVVGADLSKPAG